MTQTRILKDPIFTKKGKVPNRVVDLLRVDNGGADITRAMGVFKAKTSSTPYVTPVITVNNVTGNILGSRVVARGPVFTTGEEHRVPAREIWSQASTDTALEFTVDGTALKFGSDQSPNVSDWVNLGSLPGYKVVDTRTGATLSAEQIGEEEGVKQGASVRVILQIHDVKSVGATLQVAPWALPDLKDVASRWNIDVNAANMPGVPLYKFYAFDRNGAPSRTFQPQNVFWAVREAKDDGWGIGILPLIEILGTIQEQLVPSQADLEKEMVEMLRAFTPVSQVGDPGAAAELLLSKERPAVPEVKPAWQWPKYKPAAQSPASTPVTSTPGKARHLQSGSAKASPRVTDFGKYSPAHGLMKADRLDRSIPENIRITLADSINSSLAYQTWRSVRSVKRRVEECEVQTGTDMSIPWNQRKLATFTGWCLQRGLRSQTVENYLSKVRERTPGTCSPKCFTFAGEETP